MARPEEAKAVEAFKKAKKPKEMVDSWASQTPGRPMERQWEIISTFAEKAPWILEYYAQRGLQNIMDRGVLDRKTRELIMIGMLMVLKDSDGIAAHVANAKAAGVTEEELAAVAEIACYEASKTMCISVLVNLKKSWEYSKDVTLYKP